jgi:hypothetical protein
MDQTQHLLQTPDLCSVAMLAGILYLLGKKMAGGLQRIHSAAGRLACLVFLAYAVYDWHVMSPTEPVKYLEIAIRSLCAAAFVHSAALVIFSMADFLLHSLFAGIASRVRLKLANARYRKESQRREQEEERKRRLAQEEYERLAPQRAQATLEAAARAKAAAAAQRRRDEARAACDVLYSLHYPEIRTRFSKKDFAAFVNKYMNDDDAPDYVEARAAQLTGMIEQHRQKIDPTPRFSFEELGSWYEQTLAKIKAQSIHDRFKNAQVAQLTRHYQDLVQELLEEMKP